MKWNSAGTLQWQRSIEHEGTNGMQVGNSSDGKNTLAVDKDDDIIWAGIVFSGSSNLANNVMVIKMPEDGPTAGTYGDFKITASSYTFSASGSYTSSNVTKTVNSPSASTPSTQSRTIADHTRLTLTQKFIS